ncbi:MAG: DUF1015 family protein [bacterium]
MSIIRPFRGLRPRADLSARVASPPYDVLSSEEARAMAEGNPVSFLHVIKPEIDLDPGIDHYDDKVYEKAAANLRRFIDEGTLVQDPTPLLYLYKQRMGDHEQFGLLCCASAAEYDADRIKKHELTRADKEADRTRHVDDCDANAGPVFLTYHATDEIDALAAAVASASPDVDFVADDDIAHTLWVIRDPATIDQLTTAFAKLEALYVADGHHRSASAAAVARRRAAANPSHTGDEEYNFFLAVLFPHNQLQILDYNRVVKDLANHTPDSLLAAIKRKFEVSEAPSAAEAKPTRVHDFAMHLDRRWYRLTARPGTFPADDPVASLDVSILQENLLAPELGIGDPRKDQRIDFVGGIRGLAELERRCAGAGDQAWAVAFAFYPTSIEQLLSVADAGKIMPPKSTWFEPKLRSGLVVHLLS